MGGGPMMGGGMFGGGGTIGVASDQSSQYQQSPNQEANLNTDTHGLGLSMNTTINEVGLCHQNEDNEEEDNVAKPDHKEQVNEE